MNINPYYINALHPGLQDAMKNQKTVLKNAKRIPGLLNSNRNNLIWNAIEGNESMQYYFILTLLLEY